MMTIIMIVKYIIGLTTAFFGMCGLDYISNKLDDKEVHYYES